MYSVRKAIVLAAGIVSAMAAPVFAADATDAPKTDAPQAQAKGDDTGVMTTTFTVEKIDPATRVVTLKAPDGSVQEVPCGPEVRNFDQIKVGDKITAAVTEDIAIDVQPGAAAAKAEETAIASRAADGEKPSGVLVQSGQVTGKVMAIDPDKRTISLQDQSGKQRTIKTRPNLDLSKINKGDEVTVQFTHATAIIVGTPSDQAQLAATTMPSAPTTKPASD